MNHTVIFSFDHAGALLYPNLVEFVQEMGYQSLNLGPPTSDPVDYPDYAALLVQALHAAKGHYGVLLCGSGIGMSIAANRYPGIRAALCTSEYEARTARAHNDANVLCLGSRVIGPGVARCCLKEFLLTPFAGGRHLKRIAKIDEGGVP